MSNSALDVVVAGHLCLELIPRFLNPTGLKISEILRPGSLVNTAEMTIGTGGAVSNTGFALKIFGCHAAFIAKVGNDAIGAMTLDILRKYGSSDGVVITDGVDSSYTVCIAPAGVDRIFLHCPGTNDEFTHRDIDFDLVNRARLFHFGYPTLMKRLIQNDGEEAVLLFEKAKQTGVTTSLDITLPDPYSDGGKADWNRVYRRLLPAVDIFMPSIEEAYYTLFPEKYLVRQAEFDGEEILNHFTPDEYSGHRRAVPGDGLCDGCAKIRAQRLVFQIGRDRSTAEYGESQPIGHRAVGRCRGLVPGFRGNFGSECCRCRRQLNCGLSKRFIAGLPAGSMFKTGQLRRVPEPQEFGYFGGSAFLG